jgi:hypothetical protein
MKSIMDIRTIAAAGLVVLLAGVWGCDDDGGEAPEPDGSEVVIPPKDLEKAVYHDGIGAWIVPQKDPYALENVRAAYDNLYPQSATRADKALKATHYALRIFPRDEDEQWIAELDEDVRVSYIPFDYVALTEEQAQELEEAAATRAGSRPTFGEASPYTVVYDQAETVEGPIEGEVSLGMPIVYAVWPVDKALPAELDYELDYEVCIPEAETPTRGAGDAQALEDEAIRLALGYNVARPAAATRAGAVLSGECWVWESLREVKGPVPGVKVKFTLGSKIVETLTDDEGRFSVEAASVPTVATWDIIFQNPKWKITRETSAVPKNVVQGDVYGTKNSWSAKEVAEISIQIQPYDATIIKALNYYYYDSHVVSKWEDTNGVRVIANNNGSNAYNGTFTYSGSSTCYITIYRNNTNDRNYLMGTVLHEIGHFVHFKERGGSQKFKLVDRLLQESFASYIGWYLTDQYYVDLGYTRSIHEDVSQQSRQFTWYSTVSGDIGYYSPLFVDLADNYDQKQYSPESNYNSDQIKDVNFSIIGRIAREGTSWESCKNILKEYPEIVKQGLDAFFAPYDKWYAR